MKTNAWYEDTERHRLAKTRGYAGDPYRTKGYIPKKKPVSHIPQDIPQKPMSIYQAARKSDTYIHDGTYFSNGHVLLKIPRDLKTEQRLKDLKTPIQRFKIGKEAKEAFKGVLSAPYEKVAEIFVEEIEKGENFDFVKLSHGEYVDNRLLDFVLYYYPDAQFFSQFYNDRNKFSPVIVESKGKFVGFIMPIQR